MGFYVLFFILYFLFNEITYMIAVDQSIGINTHISSGSQCWINRFLFLFILIWYLGIIVGSIVFVLTILTFSHLTLGWIFNIPQLFISNESNIIFLSELRASAIIIINPITLVFVIISVLRVEYCSFTDLLVNNHIILCYIIFALIAGFILRIIISRVFN